MRNYINSKSVLAVDQGWLYWTTPEFKKNNPNSDQVAALLFVMREKEIGILYKPTPVLDADKKKLLGIIGNMLKEGSTPGIIKIDGGEIGSCFTIQVFEDIPKNFCPKIALQPEMLKDSEWDEATKNLALVVLPTLAPLPFGKEIKSTMLENNFLNKMMKISPDHGFWAKMMVNAFAQEDSDHDTLPIITNLNNSKATSKGRHPCHAATKGFRNAWPSNSGPAIDPSCVGKNHEAEQAKSRILFIITQCLHVPRQSRRIEMTSMKWYSSAAQTPRPTRPAPPLPPAQQPVLPPLSPSLPLPAHLPLWQGGAPSSIPGRNFNDQLIAAMKNFAAP
jgi:hypothetical protein